MVKPMLATAAFLCACADTLPLRIAVVGGDGTPIAAELAVEDINAAGGIRGRLLELEIVNERPGVTPQDAIAVAERLAADPTILAVVGHGGSGTSLAASQIYNAHGVPQIAPTTSSPLYTNAGPFSFRLVASDIHQADFIARHVATIGPRSVAVLYVNDDYGRALHDALIRALTRAKTSVVYDTPFVAGDAFALRMDDLVRSIEGAKPELLIWVGLSSELRQLRPALRAVAPRIRVLGSDGASFISTTADRAPFVGDWIVAYTDVTTSRPALRRVADRFKPLSGRALTDGAAMTYDATAMVAEAMRFGGLSRAAIERTLARWAASRHVYDGVTGPISFDQHGDAMPSYVMLEVHLSGTRPVQ